MPAVETIRKRDLSKSAAAAETYRSRVWYNKIIQTNVKKPIWSVNGDIRENNPFSQKDRYASGALDL